MKSPWKFLVGIARRNHEQAKPDASLTSGDETPVSYEPTTAPIEQKAAPAHKGVDLTVVSASDYEDSEHVDDLPTLSAIAAAAAKKEKSPLSTFGRERARKRRSKAVTRESRGIKPEPAQAAKPADETRALDDEILRLRVQLAERLEVQNSQLRKLLARFEN